MISCYSYRIVRLISFSFSRRILHECLHSPIFQNSQRVFRSSFRFSLFSHGTRGSSDYFEFFRCFILQVWAFFSRNSNIFGLLDSLLRFRVLTEQLSYSLFLELPKRLGFENQWFTSGGKHTNLVIKILIFILLYSYIFSVHYSDYLCLYF